MRKCGCQPLERGPSAVFGHCPANGRTLEALSGGGTVSVPERPPRRPGQRLRRELGCRVGMTSLGPTYFWFLAGTWAEFVLSHSDSCRLLLEHSRFPSLHPTRVAIALAFPSLDTPNTPIQTCYYQYPDLIFHLDVCRPLRGTCPTGCEYLKLLLRVTSLVLASLPQLQPVPASTVNLIAT